MKLKIGTKKIRSCHDCPAAEYDHDYIGKKFVSMLECGFDTQIQDEADNIKKVPFNCPLIQALTSVAPAVCVS